MLRGLQVTVVETAFEDLGADRVRVLRLRSWRSVPELGSGTPVE